MAEKRFAFSVFTKPWRTLPALALADRVARLGFDGVELPVRPGFQVEPESVAQLPVVARQFAERGLRVYSVAGPADEAVIAACGDAGVPILRVMAPIGDEGYMASVERTRREYDALLPLLEKHGVQLGVQNHCDRFVANAMELRYLLRGYDPRLIGAVWDAAHEALSGALPEFALDIIRPHLCMVNLKNGMWVRQNGPEAEWAEWQHYWTSGRHGLAPWPRVAAELKRGGYRGVVCLTAEYSDQGAVERLAAEDLAFARSLFEE